MHDRCCQAGAAPASTQGDARCPRRYECRAHDKCVAALDAAMSAIRYRLRAIPCARCAACRSRLDTAPEPPAMRGFVRHALPVEKMQMHFGEFTLEEQRIERRQPIGFERTRLSLIHQIDQHALLPLPQRI